MNHSNFQKKVNFFRYFAVIGGSLGEYVIPATDVIPGTNVIPVETGIQYFLSFHHIFRQFINSLFVLRKIQEIQVYLFLKGLRINYFDANFVSILSGNSSPVTF